MNRAAFATLYADATAIPSNPNFAYPGLDSPVLSISSSTPFEFLGVELAGWVGITPAATSVTVFGYRSGTLVGSISKSLSATVWSSSGALPGVVDTLVFSPNNRYFRMDNLRTATPEPATMVLLGAGLIALCSFRKRLLGNK